MNPKKAKEIIDLNIKEAGKKMPPDVKDALFIGSGAIGAILQYRLDMDPQWFALLPGETKD